MADFYTNRLVALERQKAADEERRRYEESANRQLLAQIDRRREGAEKHRLDLARELGTAAGMLDREGPRFAEGQRMEQQVADVARTGAQAQVANAREMAKRKAQAEMDRIAQQQELMTARQTAVEGAKQKGRLELQQQKHVDNLARDAQKLKNEIVQQGHQALNDIVERRYDFYFDSLLAQQKHQYDQALERLKVSIEQEMTGLTPQQQKTLRLKLSAINAMGSQAKGMMSNALQGLLFRGDQQTYNQASKTATDQFFNANLELQGLLKQLGMGGRAPAGGAPAQSGATPAQPGAQPAGTEGVINRADLSTEEKIRLLQGMP